MDVPLATTAPHLALQRAVDQAQSAARSSPEVAGERLEALFATLLVKELRRGLPNEGFFGGGAGADTYNGWLDEHLGEALAAAGALDLAGRVKAALEARAPETEQGR